MCSSKKGISCIFVCFYPKKISRVILIPALPCFIYFSYNVSTFGPNGNLFVLHTGVSGAPSGVLEFDGLSGAFVRDFVPLGSCGLEFGNDCDFGPDGDLYVTDKVAGVFVFDGQTGECIGSDVLIADPSGGPGGDRFEALAFALDSDNLLLPWGVDDAPWGRVTEHDPASGALIGTPIPPGLGEMHAATTGHMDNA